MPISPRPHTSLLHHDDALLSMDCTPDRCAVIGTDGSLEQTNLPWERDSRSLDPVGVQAATTGFNYLGACARAAAAGNRRAGTMHAQLKRLFAGEVARVSMDFERPAMDGSIDHTTADLERLNCPDGQYRVMISFASKDVCIAQPTSVPEAGFAIPSGSRLDRLSTALDSLAAHAAILDTKGRILSVNAAWRLFAAVNGGNVHRTGAGVSYLAICEQAIASGDGRATTFADGLKAVLRGERHTFQNDSRVGLGGEARRFRGRATSMALAEGRFILVTHTEMTAAAPARQAAQLRVQEPTRQTEAA